MSCLIVFRSMTQAQNAANILLKSGISSAQIKPPVQLGRGSCAFGLIIGSQYLPVALRLLQKTAITPLGIFESTPSGWREVIL